MPTGNMCPIFPISCISKLGFPHLIEFIYKLEKRQTNTREESAKQSFEFEINENFLVEGVGLVLSGIVRSGVATLNKQCLLGPDILKNFKTVVIKSIHINRVNRDEAYAGELACICVKAIKATEKLIRKDIRRGMVVIDNENKPQPVNEFEA